MVDDYPSIKAAAVQAAPVFLDRERTLAKACDLIAEAGRNGVDVVVFPEGFVPGHPLWYHFHPATTEVSERLATRLFKNAVTVPGDAVKRITEAADQADTYVVMGVCEKKPNTTGTMYNSQVFVSPEGELLGKHQKIKPTVGEQLVHAEGNRTTFGTVQAEFGPMSGLICGENSNPLAIFALASEHTRIHAMSWPPSARARKDLPERSLTVARAFAQMTKSFVVSANGVLDDRMIDLMELDTVTAENIRSAESSGGSVIVGPDMDTVAGPLANEEEILYGTLDIEASVEQKLTHDFAGHYNRSDLFQLSLNRTNQELVTIAEAGSEAEPATDGNVTVLGQRVARETKQKPTNYEATSPED